MDKIKFLNIFINNISLLDLLHNLTEKGGIVVTPNVDHLVKLQSDSLFLKAYKIADYVVCDSKILEYILKLLGTPVKEKISGSDLLPAFYHYNRSNPDVKIFLLGGEEGVAQKARTKINEKVGRNIVVDALSPSFGFEHNALECLDIIQQINQSSANVLVIGVGSPKQEKWIVKYRSSLPNIKVFLPIGATIDFEAGNKVRSPSWMSNIGLEWLYRLISEPKRLWKRYLVDSMPFFIYTIRHYFNIYHRHPILELQSLPLGEILLRAGLLSSSELNLVLDIQKEKKYQVKIGEIITDLGLLSSETINFFTDSLPRIIHLKEVLPLGYYLQQAHLISEKEINLLIEKQKNANPRKLIGQLIIENNDISQQTINWFIELQYVLKSQSR